MVNRGLEYSNDKNGNAKEDNRNAEDEDKLCRVTWQVFVSWVINLHFNGCNAAMTGLIIDGLKDPSSSVRMTSDEESWFASFFLIGGAVGIFACGIQSSFLGRKKTVMLTQIFSFVGALCILLAKNVGMFYLGNSICGYTNGVFLGIAPVYTGEICQPNIRKFTGSILAVMFNVGFAFAYFVGSLSHWKIAASVQTAWPCIVFILLLLCPESPTWLLIKGQKDLAIATLLKLRGNKVVTMTEVSRIENNLEKQKQSNTDHVHSSFFQNHLRIMKQGTFLRPCLVLLILMSICWHWTGGYVLILHTVIIIKEFEVPIPADWTSAGIGIYQLICAIVGVGLSSLVSRRKLYIGSGVCIFLGLFMLATTVHLKKYDFFVEALKKHSAVSWIPFIALLIYFAGYSVGWVSVCFMLLGELLPSNAKGLGSFMVVECSMISAILLVKFLPNLKEQLGLDGLFWMFSGISIFAILFVYFCVPETFGRNLEEIEEHYRNICYPNQSQNLNNVTDNFNLAYMSD